ncbi:MAG TPA: type II secretion system protein [Methylococcaceae bacterium]|nr:type II secretion system protein [Methylococcaceae bacterium]
MRRISEYVGWVSGPPRNPTIGANVGLRRGRLTQPTRSTRQSGFTLVEAILVIVITGILAGVVSVFIRGPVQGYFDSARRAGLTDIADTALRRMARDIQSALPNSVRVSGGAFVEFVPIKSAGRYRAVVGGGAGDDALDFASAADASFDVLGPTVTVASGDSVVIYNLGVPGADVYAGSSRRAASAPFGSVAKVAFSPAGTQFPFASPGSRFQVVSSAVTYACDGAGNLWRYAYAIQSAQPAGIAALDGLGGTKALLASKLSACSFAYSAGALERSGMVAAFLEIQEEGERVSLLHQINVINTP